MPDNEADLFTITIEARERGGYWVVLTAHHYPATVVPALAGGASAGFTIRDRWRCATHRGARFKANSLRRAMIRQLAAFERRQERANAQ